MVRLDEEEASGPVPPAPPPDRGGNEDGSEEEDEPSDYVGPEESRAQAACRARPPLPKEELQRRIEELELQLLPDQLVTQEFRQLCWCQPCRRAFRVPAGLLSHLQSQQHPPAGEAIMQLQRQR